jgi:uncharacterized protein YbjQ (UPF0145 family)
MTAAVRPRGAPSFPAAGHYRLDIDYGSVGNNMLMVSASGTAVKLG